METCANDFLIVSHRYSQCTDGLLEQNAECSHWSRQPADRAWATAPGSPRKVARLRIRVRCKMNIPAFPGRCSQGRYLHKNPFGLWNHAQSQNTRVLNRQKTSRRKRTCWETGRKTWKNNQRKTCVSTKHPNTRDIRILRVVKCAI